MLLNILFGLWSLSKVSSIPTVSDRAPLRVVIENCRSTKGHILIAIFNSDSTLSSHNPSLAVASARISAEDLKHADFQLPPGNYAILVTHDLNNNLHLDKNFFGIPKEPIGVSNGFKSRLRKPTFAECAFPLRRSPHQVRVRLVDF